jgi:hypothetical protein
MTSGRKIPAKHVSIVALSIATGAGLRAAIAIWGMSAPLHWVVAKIGLTETLTFVNGLALGVSAGFMTGVGIIAVADLAMGWAGAWTPFIAVIIGLLGMIGGLLRRLIPTPSRRLMGLSAVCLTGVSELLQTLWFAWFFGVPFIGAFLMGLPSLVAALINNFILFTAIGPWLIEVLKRYLQ